MFESLGRIMRRILARAAVLVVLLLTIAALFVAAADAQSVDDFARWYAAFCAIPAAEQGTIFSVAAWVFTAVGVSAVLANFRSRLPGPIVALLDFLGANWAPLLKRFMDGGTKVAALALVIVAGFVLSACTAAQLQQAQADIAAGIAAACKDVNAVAALPGADPNLKVYADAACPLATASAALVQSSATLQWLGSLQGQLAATATVAAK